ncbi:MAG TPA: hypothetical protein VK063_04635 [Beutenbergiaceae bacterium]|nr:hypothetical protein [Beutenbergiaceae bacterium]
MVTHTNRSHRLTAGTRLGLIATLSAALALGAGATTAHATLQAAAPQGAQDVHDEGEVTDLGVAMQSVNVRLSAVGELSDGTPVAYLFSDGEPVSFNMVDLRTGDLLDSYHLAPYSVASSITVADDGVVYFSVRSPNDGSLWRYDPEVQELSQVATGIAGEQMLRTLDTHEQTLYGTTYPNANLFAMDLQSQEITEYGRIAPEGDYAWGLDADDDGVWVGSGTPAQLHLMNPEEGSVAPVDLPEPVAAGGEFIQRIEKYGDVRIVSHRAVDGMTAHLHDGSEWVDALDVRGMWHYTADAEDGNFYYLDGQNDVWAYDVNERTTTQIDVLDSTIADELGATSQVFLADLGTQEFPGSSLVGVRADGRIWRLNLQTGHADVILADAQGAPVTTMSIAEGGDGQVYIGAYLSPGVLAAVDPATNTITQLDGPEQADSITAHGDLTIFGTYPNAEFFATDHTEPWDWGTNPAHVLTLGRAESGQDRPRHMISAGDVVAIGTIPNYGELGGALTLLDPATGEFESHRDVVPGQSVTDLAYADGVVYAGTSIHGGLDSTPTATTAEVFAWSIDDGLIASTPVPGAEVVHSLEFDQDGRLWAMADTGELLEYDVMAHEFDAVLDSGIPHTNVWGSASSLDLNEADGMLYGAAGNRLFRFDSSQQEVEVLVASGVRRSTVAHGDVFFTDETNVYRYHLGASDPICDEEMTGVHRGPLRVTDGTTCITDADINGPITVGSGASLVLTDSDTNGPIRASGALDVQLLNNQISGPVQISDSTGRVHLEQNSISGPLSCTGNEHQPTGEQNNIRGPASGQCQDLGS